VRAKAQRFLDYCKENGVETPPTGRGKGWGPWPQNAFRRTALSLHFKLFFDKATTVIWAGTSGEEKGGMFRAYYKRMKDMSGHLFTKQDAANYWLILPTCMKAAMAKINWGNVVDGRIVGLPDDHKLSDVLGIHARQALAHAAATARITDHTTTARISRLRARLISAQEELELAKAANPGARLMDLKSYVLCKTLKYRIRQLEAHAITDSGQEPVVFEEFPGSFAAPAAGTPVSPVPPSSKEAAA
jgi:hypothetical protein